MLNQQGFQPIEEAIKYLQSATVLDPQYAEAWAQLAIAESQKCGYEHTAAQLDRARVAAETAVLLQPESGETHESLATYYYYGLHDFDRALAEMERARSYAPNNPSATFYIGLIKRRQGKLDESIDDQRKAAMLDPRNPDIWLNLSGSYRGKRDFQHALEMVDRALAISPDELDLVGYQAEIHAAQGDLDGVDEVLRGRPMQPGNEAFYQRIVSLLCRRRFDQALAAFAQTEGSLAKLPPLMKAWRRVLQGEVDALAGNAEEARPILLQACRDLLALRAAGNASKDVDTAMVEASGFLGDRAQLDREAEALLAKTRNDRWQFGLSQQIAGGAYAAIGDADRAMPLITDALAAQCDNSLTVASLQQHPVWDRIRNDPRFQKLCEEKKP